ncbi:MAG: hypothetical protein GY884_33225 [Proteobacteria bacterium]|nr:hypothetical protein [Pseudomonadota bacterium]
MHILLHLSCALPPSVEAGAPTDVERLPLAEGAAVQGVHRAAVVDLGGVRDESPTLAVDGRGGTWLAWASWDGSQERLVLQGPNGQKTTVFEGRRAAHPTLEAHGDQVFLAWTQDAGQGSQVVLTEIGSDQTQLVGEGGHPALSVGSDGVVTVAWERGGRVEVRRMDTSDTTTHDGFLLRRPDVAAIGDGTCVAWDALVSTGPTGERDPDYDLFVDCGDGPEQIRLPGIQAAPQVLEGPDGDLLLACHDSWGTGGIVKWWTLFRKDADGWSHLLDTSARREHTGENQGAEFPEVVVTPQGGLVVVTRSSHGAQVQTVSAFGVSPPLDLTRSLWGARGLHADAVYEAATGSVRLVRRARRGPVLETLMLEGVEGLPEFEPLAQVERSLDQALAPKDLVFGDVHMHSALSDGTGPPDEILARAWVRGLSFAVLTDHDYIVGSHLMPSEHDEVVWLTEKFNSLDGFTTIHGYEWTTPPTWREGSGHQNVYFRGDPALHSSKGSSPGLSELNVALADERAFTAPHHTSWTGTPWAEYDPAIQRHVEIVSVHGLSEKPGEQSVEARHNDGGTYAVDGLAAGLEFGFLGGSDGHGLRWHHGISRKEDPWVTGLTGVDCAQPCGREALWDALYGQQTWATTGEEMVARVRVDGRTVHWTAGGTAPLEQVLIIRDGVEANVVELSTVEAQGRWVDTDADAGAHSYYIRVVQPGPELAWSSPVFVEVP